MTTFCSYLPLPTCPLYIPFQPGRVLASVHRGTRWARESPGSQVHPHFIDQNHSQKDAKAPGRSGPSRAPPDPYCPIRT